MEVSFARESLFCIIVKYDADVDFLVQFSEMLSHFEKVLYQGITQDGILPPDLLAKVLKYTIQGYHALWSLQGHHQLGFLHCRETSDVDGINIKL